MKMKKNESKNFYDFSRKVKPEKCNPILKLQILWLIPTYKMYKKHNVYSISNNYKFI